VPWGSSTERGSTASAPDQEARDARRDGEGGEGMAAVVDARRLPQTPHGVGCSRRPAVIGRRRLARFFVGGRASRSHSRATRSAPSARSTSAQRSTSPRVAKRVRPLPKAGSSPSPARLTSSSPHALKGRGAKRRVGPQAQVRRAGPQGARLEGVCLTIMLGRRGPDPTARLHLSVPTSRWARGATARRSGPAS
jgi:hypothetical protein